MNVTNTYEESLRMQTLRKIYQRALISPLSKIDYEKLWRDYDIFENSVHKDLAKEFLADFGRKRVVARNILLARISNRTNIDRYMLARPTPSTEKGQLSDYAQVILWQDVLAFEKTNPAKLSVGMLKERVIFCYKQALACVRYYPEVWYDYAQYCNEMAEEEMASEIYRTAIKVFTEIGKYPLIYFLAADFEENRKKFKEAKAIYEELIEADPSPLSYIMLQRFVRRNEGLEEARKVFLIARKKCPSPQVYIHSALIELLVNKEPKSASNVFALGFKSFSNFPDYIQEYTEFLLHQNDHQNMRMVLEKGLEHLSASFFNSTPNIKPPSSESIKLWNRYLNFECLAGSFSSIKSLLHRRMNALKLPSQFVFVGIIEQYSFMDLWPSSVNHRTAINRFVSRGCPFDFKLQFGTSLGLPIPLTTHYPFYMIGTTRACDESRRLPRPQVTSLIPYHPETSVLLPEVIKAVIETLPVIPGLKLPLDVDRLLEMILNTPLPNDIVLGFSTNGLNNGLTNNMNPLNQPPSVLQRRKHDEMELQ